MDWTHILVASIPAGSAVVVGFYQLIAYWLRVRAIMTATPAQLEALKRLEPPPFIIRRGGPVLLLVFLSAGMAAWPRTGSAAIEASAVPIARCDELTCPSPGRCVAGRCQATAREKQLPAKAPQPKRAKDKRPAISASAEAIIDSTAEHDRLWDQQPPTGALADRSGLSRL